MGGHLGDNKKTGAGIAEPNSLHKMIGFVRADFGTKE